MNNLLISLDKIKRDELANQIAEIEEYRLAKYFAVLLTNIIIVIANLLYKVSEGKIGNNKSKINMEQEYLNLARKYRLCNKNELYQSVCDNLKKCFWNLDARSDEELSVAITRKVARKLNRSVLAGKSISEINEYVFAAYPGYRIPSRLKYLRVGLVASIINVILTIVLMIKISPAILLAAIIVEIIVVLFCNSNQNWWQLAHFIWLACSSSGIVNKNQESSILGEKKQILSDYFGAIHTLTHTYVAVLEEKEHLQKVKAQNQAAIGQNQQLIKEIRGQEGKSQTEKDMIIADKNKENVRLNAEIQQLGNTIKQKQDALAQTNDSLNRLYKEAKTIILNAWKIAFPRIKVTDNALTLFIRDYSYLDLERAEKRFIELLSVGDATVIGQRRGELCYIPYVLNSGDMAQVGYSTAGNNINIQEFVREGQLLEAFLSEEKLKAIVNRFSNQSIPSDIVNQLKKENETLNTTIRSLNGNLTDCNNTINELSIKIDKNANEISKLNEDIRAKDETIRAKDEEIQHLKSSGASTEEIEKVERELAMMQKEKQELTTQLNAALNDKKALNDKIAALKKEKAQINKKYQQSQEQLTKYKGTVTLIDSEIENINELIKQYDATIITNTTNSQLSASMVRDLKGKVANKVTVEKLMESTESTKQLIEKAKADKAKALDKINELQQKKAESQKKIQEYERILENLNKRIEQYSITTLANQEITDAMWYVLMNAKKEICILSPWLGKVVDKKLDIGKNFIAAIEKKLKEGVTVKISYGIGEMPDYSEIDTSNIDIRTKWSVKHAHYLTERFSKYGKLFRMKKVNSHGKLMICDDDYYLIGSFNFLSFEGSYDGDDLRSEIVDKIKNPETIRIYKEKIFNY